LLNLFQMKGSLFPLSFLTAAPCAAFAGGLKHFKVIGQTEILNDNTLWGGFSFLVGFLIVFRTSEAYSRFWGGCTATHQMRAEWSDAASAIMSFCKHSTAPEKEILHFKHIVIRLFSLLHTMALGDIEECEDIEAMVAFDLELIDPNGLDKETWRALSRSHHKVALVFQWIQSVIVENIRTGVLSIPPPILSRVFQELANGMVALHEASKISTIPFPFPYAQTCDALLVIHWMLTPFVTCQWANGIFWTVVFSFIQVFVLWSLNNIAVEIEHPFGTDANDLDASQMQIDMNTHLLLLLEDTAARIPTLSSEAIITGLTSLGRRASTKITAVATYNDIQHQQEAEAWTNINGLPLGTSLTTAFTRDDFLTPQSSEPNSARLIGAPSSSSAKREQDALCASPLESERSQHTRARETSPLVLSSVDTALRIEDQMLDLANPKDRTELTDTPAFPDHAKWLREMELPALPVNLVGHPSDRHTLRGPAACQDIPKTSLGDMMSASPQSAHSRPPEEFQGGPPGPTPLPAGTLPALQLRQLAPGPSKSPPPARVPDPRPDFGAAPESARGEHEVPPSLQ